MYLLAYTDAHYSTACDAQKIKLRARMLQECTHQIIVLAGSFGKRYEIAALFLNFLRYEKTYMECSSMYHNVDCLHMTTGAHSILYKIERSL